MTEKYLLEILNELRRQNKDNRELWQTDDIADYVGLRPSTVHSTLLPRKDFPRAVIIPTTEDGGGRRWYAADVKNWIKKNREPIR